MMLRSHVRRVLAAVSCAVAVAGLAHSAHDVARAAPGRLPVAAGLQQQATPTVDPDKVYYYLGGFTPCNTKGGHTITPQTVEEGKNVTVKVNYEFNCGTEEVKQLDVVFMVENTGSLKINNVNGQQQPLYNLKLAMSDLVRNIDPLNGSRVGMVKYGCDNHTDPPIGKGQDHYERFRSAVQAMNGNLPGGSNPGTALREASGQIAALAKPDPTNPPSFIIIIDAGGIPCQGQPRPQAAEIADACDAAKANQATVILVALQPSGGRLRGCNTPGWYFRSSNENGTDLKGIFDDIKDRIFKGSRPYRTAYTVYPNTYYWEYVFGTGVPSEPSVTFPDLAWEEDLAGRRRAAFSYEYQMRAREASAPAAWVSIAIADAGIPSPLIQFLYNDGTSDSIVVPDTPLCIYRPGKASQDCGPFLNQIAGTAEAGTATAVAFNKTPDAPPPTATDTPPGDPPTNTPDVPTNTPESATEVPTTAVPTRVQDTPPPPTDATNFDVYLPWSARAFGF